MMMAVLPTFLLFYHEKIFKVGYMPFQDVEEGENVLERICCSSGMSGI